MSSRALRALAFLHLAAFVATAQSVPDYAVRVNAVVQTNPARITLSWPGDVRATNYAVFRKTRDATTWGVAKSLATNATTYVDSSVSSGSAYEYRVRKYCWTGTTNYTGEGYIYAGIAVPMVEYRGKLILLVDNTVAPSLAMELARLELDLVGDGWTVLRHDVARHDPVPNIKALIKADYTADPANVKAVFLFGHVPVPYSGDIYPDGHTNHWGAWPADVYYGEMNSTWTDTTVNNVSAADARNRNVPGDGKFDQSLIPSAVELQVGRVDLANLPAFPLSEVELLRQYLNKNHNFRHGFLAVERRGLIDDHFGVFGGEAFAANGWRGFAPFFGASNTFAGDWLTTLSTQSHLWAFGCGSGSYTGAGGVATTSQLAASDPRVVFTALFGSYFGDWDSPDNFLRAQLATPTYTLASAWAGRPHWMFHHMALGETLGFSTRVTQNNSTTYAGNLALRWVHIALMGDPTLRMHPVAPPRALTVNPSGATRVQLRWLASTDPVAGYHVYRAETAAGPFTRLTPSLITATNYLDFLVSSNVYLVRAVKLETSASGNYYNPSQGIFQSLDPSLALPSIVLSRPTNNASLYELANVPLVVSTFDPAAGIERVEFYANGVKLGGTDTPPFGFTWSNAPAGDYSLSATAFFREGPSTTTNPVAVHVAVVPPPTLGITDLGDGSLEIRGQGTAGLTYRFQFTEDLGHTNWQTLGAATANASGVFALTNTPTASPQFFRSAYP
jgi:hypothetical protein